MLSAPLGCSRDDDIVCLRWSALRAAWIERTTSPTVVPAENKITHKWPMAMQKELVFCFLEESGVARTAK